MTEIKKVKLFNKEGSDKLEDQKIIGGSPTGVSNLNENAFKWTNNLYRIMLGNHWIPEKVSMIEDKITIDDLTEDEYFALKRTLAFLIYLDSYQCANLPNISQYVTLPQVRDLILLQQMQEVVHTQSYQYTLDSLFPLTTRDEIYNMWRDDPVLLKRVEYIASIGESFQNNPTVDNFKKIIAMNYILESIYFYHGFIFFHNLASRQKLVQSNVMINYIKNDENTHMALFRNIIMEIFDKKDMEMLVEMMHISKGHEVEWAKHVYGNKILGMNDTSAEQYLNYLVNFRCKSLGLDLPYPDQGMNNPYAHLEEKTRGNYFESAAITEYDRADSIPGWDF